MTTYRVRMAWTDHGVAETATRVVEADCGAEARELVARTIANEYRGGDDRGIYCVEIHRERLCELVTGHSARPMLARGCAQ